MAGRARTDGAGGAPSPGNVAPGTDGVGRRLRALRRERGWSLSELSERCGVSRSMLSQVEREEANPTLVVAFRIAAALGVSLDELAATELPGTPISVIRRSDPRLVFRDDDDCRIRTLSALELEKDVELYEVLLRPGRSLASSAHYRGTREFLTVQSGAVRVTAAGGTVDLAAGDSAHYRADVAHVLENRGPSEALVLLVDVYGPH
ncbi:MAG: transcriptional regulator, family [Acidimicrobiaceae bacterium]|nr:transcriptional regulator, family [Acidimicrobiaceae bacterium]